MNYQSAILTYLSSSELNRCKKNGLKVLEPRKVWFDVLSEPWLTRKLRRKLGHLIQLDLMPVIYQPIMGYGKSPLWGYLNNHLANKLMQAEDEIIMKGATT